MDAWAEHGCLPEGMEKVGGISEAGLSQRFEKSAGSAEVEKSGRS